MKPILRSVVASTVLVIAYPIALIIILTPFGILFGQPAFGSAMDVLMIPMALPVQIMEPLFSLAAPGGRMPIELTIFLLTWFVAFNATLYYVPVRLFLEWQEQRIRLR